MRPTPPNYWIAILIFVGCALRWAIWVFLDIGLDHRSIDLTRTYLVPSAGSEPTLLVPDARIRQKIGLTVVVVANTLDGVFFVTPYLIFRHLRNRAESANKLPVWLLVLGTTLFYVELAVGILDQLTVAGDWPGLIYIMVFIIQGVIAIVFIGSLLRGRGKGLSRFDLWSCGIIAVYSALRFGYWVLSF